MNIVNKELPTRTCTMSHRSLPENISNKATKRKIQELSNNNNTCTCINKKLKNTVCHRQELRRQELKKELSRAISSVNITIADINKNTRTIYERIARLRAINVEYKLHLKKMQNIEKD